MLLKCCSQYVSKFEKFTSGHRIGKSHFFFIQIPKKGNVKKCLNYCTIVLISHANKVMLRNLQVRLEQYMNWEFPDVQAGFGNGRGTTDQFANIHWIIGKTRRSQKNMCVFDYAKAFDCVDHNCGQFLNRREYQTTLSVSGETGMQVKEQ